VEQNTFVKTLIFSSLQPLYEILITLLECGNHTPDQTYAENYVPTKNSLFCGTNGKNTKPQIAIPA